MITGGNPSPTELHYFRPDALAGNEFVQPSGSLSVTRLHHTSDLLPDGRVMTVGGSFVDPSPTSDIFDPATETVIPGPNMTHARFGPSGTSLDGKIYVCGEHIDDVVGKQCEVYDAAANSWQPIADSQFNHDSTDLGKQS